VNAFESKQGCNYLAFITTHLNGVFDALRAGNITTLFLFYWLKKHIDFAIKYKPAPLAFFIGAGGERQRAALP